MSVYTENTVVYTSTTVLSNAYVLSNTACVLSTIMLANITAGSVSSTVYYNQGGVAQPLVYNMTLPAYSSVNILTGKYMMKSGSYFTASASANSSIYLTFSGIERTN